MARNVNRPEKRVSLAFGGIELFVCTKKFEFGWVRFRAKRCLSEAKEELLTWDRGAFSRELAIERRRM